MPKISTPDLDDPADAERAAAEAEHEHHDTEARFAAGQLDDPGAVEQAAEKAGRLRRLAEMVTTRAAHRAERNRQDDAERTVDELAGRVAAVADADAALAEQIERAAAEVAELHRLAEARRHEVAAIATAARSLAGHGLHAEQRVAAYVSGEAGPRSVTVDGRTVHAVAVGHLVAAGVGRGPVAALGEAQQTMRSGSAGGRARDLSDAADRGVARLAGTRGGA